MVSKAVEQALVGLGQSIGRGLMVSDAKRTESKRLEAATQIQKRRLEMEQKRLDMQERKGHLEMMSRFQDLQSKGALAANPALIDLAYKSIFGVDEIKKDSDLYKVFKASAGDTNQFGLVMESLSTMVSTGKIDKKGMKALQSLGPEQASNLLFKAISAAETRKMTGLQQQRVDMEGKRLDIARKTEARQERESQASIELAQAKTAKIQAEHQALIDEENILNRSANVRQAEQIMSTIQDNDPEPVKLSKVMKAYREAMKDTRFAMSKEGGRYLGSLDKIVDNLTKNQGFKDKIAVAMSSITIDGRGLPENRRNLETLLKLDPANEQHKKIIDETLVNLVNLGDPLAKMMARMFLNSAVDITVPAGP